MNKYFKIKFGFVAILVVFLFSFTANAATLDLVLQNNITSPKDDVVVLVSINSENQDVNTAQATINFPANLLEVTSVDRTDSIFSFWLQEPVYDNAKGTINFTGGSTSGFSGSNLKLMKISFKVKGSGTGKLGINNAAITASDGTGSNVYNTAKGLEINIPASAQFQAVTLEKAKQQATLAQKLPSSTISIPFYPDSTKWNNRSASFKATWGIGTDVINAGILIDKNQNSIPFANVEGMIGNKIFPALTDGVWYLHLRLQNNVGWGQTINYRLAVDITPPGAFKINSVDTFKTGNPMPTITFASSDVMSGISDYVIRLDGKTATTTTSSIYRFSPLLPGVHQLTVTAVDNAGNSTSQTETIEILPVASPEITYVSRDVIVDSGAPISAGGTSFPKAKIIVQVQNAQKQVITEHSVFADDNGNWNIIINENLDIGSYVLLVTAQDQNLASSFPITSGTVNVKAKPMLVIGSLEVTQGWFFIIFIVILICAFGAGWFTYRKWREQLDRRVTIAQRDVINIFDNMDKEIDSLLKSDLSKDNVEQIKTTLKNMKSGLDKSRNYVIANIREIEK